MGEPARPTLLHRSVVLGIGACIASLASVVAGGAVRGTVAVERLALAGNAEGQRLLIDLGAPSRAQVFALEAPDRVVVDIAAASLDRRRVRLPAPAGAVRQVRVAPHDGGGLRIVLDVGRHLQPALLADGSGRHLVVQLSGNGGEATEAPPAAPLARAVAPPPRDLVIAVDAGHGGFDPGATGRGGTHEKDVTLAVARALAERINSEPGMRAILTRDGDYFVELADRVRRAHEAKANLFVSVHADAIADRSVTGASVYVLSQRGASSETAKLLADRENAAVLIGAPLPENDDVVASVVLDFAKSAAMSASSEAAGKVLEQLNEVGEIRKATVQQAGFVVLKAAAMPSMLIESAYITNPGEERRLRDPRHQARLADAILAGLRNYFHENPPPGTRMAAIVAGAGGAPPRSLER